MRSVVMVVLLAIAFLLSGIKKSISLRTVEPHCCCKSPLAASCSTSHRKMAVEQAALGVHKVMSYSDAGSAFIFGSLLGPKMDVLFDGAGLSFAFAYSRRLSSSLRSSVCCTTLADGAANSHPWQHFSESFNISKIESFCCGYNYFPGKMRSRRSLNRLSIA